LVKPTNATLYFPGDVIMKCFAYGSNMSTDFLREYCPSATFLMRAYLPNFQVEFRRYSEEFNGGISSIMTAPGELVHGVIYEIDESEILALDVLEDVPRGIYTRDTFLVLGDDGAWVQADLYRVAKPSGPYPPSTEYLDHMIAGANEHGIDPAYIAKIEALRC
jgi:gamma-glutamylcyclotransferase (GGCT)/AIG2-like uncharacterized protein YtfP